MSHPLTARPSRPVRGRHLAVGALAAVAALTVTACGGPAVGASGGDDASTGTGSDAVDWSQVEPATEITWWSNHPGASKETEEAMIADFEAETGIQVDLVTAGASYDEVAQKYQAASQSGDMPDLVIASDVWWFRYHLNDQIIALDDVFEHLEAEADDFQPALYADYEYEGQHWAAPYARSTPLFYYNKDMWQAAGLPDEGPETWDQMIEWSGALAEQVPAGGSPFGLSTGPSWGAWWFENMIWGQGGTYSDGFDLTLDTDEAVAGGQFLSDLFHGIDGAAPVATVSSTDAVEDFSAGVIASTIGSTGSLTGILEAAEFEVGTAYLPDGPAGGGSPTGGTGLAISASSSPEEQLAAAMLLEFLTDTENTSTFSRATGYMPVRTSAVESPTMTEVYEQTPQFRTAVDQLADKARTQDDVRVFVPGADALLNEAIEMIVLEGADPAEAFERITPQLETAYQENVEPYL